MGGCGLVDPFFLPCFQVERINKGKLTLSRITVTKKPCCGAIHPECIGSQRILFRLQHTGMTVSILIIPV